MRRRLKSIPVSAAGEIAQRYGYDQVVIVARRVGDDPAASGEHVTTYGVDDAHCDVAARIGAVLKHRLMNWPVEEAAVRDAVARALFAEDNDGDDDLDAQNPVTRDHYLGLAVVAIGAFARPRTLGTAP